MSVTGLNWQFTEMCKYRVCMGVFKKTYFVKVVVSRAACLPMRVAVKRDSTEL